ncbi:NUDIX hydrolase [Streptomyces physcomitrii]|uniref:NUDIX domain-containing protein n=1 Tax=Streptomyces physcomitrii TaxID=2724184 RepID=A0ABX1H6G5_9ACTN|nr:NUDIX domain-containing protein [Streptomyces physcomitrii]NKI43963.1 NUDIX domain-containing protein [Streptomyces physcomitrii]
MSEQLPPPSGPVDLLEVRGIRFVEGPPLRLPPGERQAMDRAWEEAVRGNPGFFDGPVCGASGLDWEGPGRLVVTWTRATYRIHALRRVGGDTVLPSLFVGVVQSAEDGGLLVGRMSSSTAAPGRWQLPGGGAEPPAGAQPLDLDTLRRHAARELAEETGLLTPPEELSLWLLTHAPGRALGLLFRAPVRPARLLRERFAALVAAERAQGRDPELDRIAFVRSPAELPGLGGRRVNYLEKVVGRYAARTG